MDVAITTGVDAIVRMVRCNLELVFKSMSQVTICTNIKMVIIFFYILEKAAPRLSDKSFNFPPIIFAELV